MDGYTPIFERMLASPLITVRLGVDFASIRSTLPADQVVVYTGPIDRYFDFAHGELGWRTVDFAWERPSTGDFQGASMMNYADADVPWTRIIEFRHFHPERDYPADRTIIAREYSRAAGRQDEPYYPIGTAEDRARYRRYKEMTEALPRVVFGGRLATYRYIDMHQAIGAALRDAERNRPPGQAVAASGKGGCPAFAGARWSATCGACLSEHAMRRNLVIVRAGDSSLHERWLAGGGDRNWDLWISYFGDDPNRFRRDDCLRIDAKGPKWSALHALISERRSEIERYDYIWLPDDDLGADLPTVNRLFDICRANDLELAQPALSIQSYGSHMITLNCSTFRLRFTTFVEIMAPCFRRDFLDRCLPTLGETISGWGLDFVWPGWASGTDKVGIVDAAVVTHTRPVGGPNYKLVSERGTTAQREAEEAFARYGVRSLVRQVTGGITQSGERLSAWDGTHPRLVAALIIGYAPFLARMPEAIVDLIEPSLVHLPPLPKEARAVAGDKQAAGGVARARSDSR